MRYAGSRRSETNPLRSLPLARPAADVLHVPQSVSTAVEPSISVWSEPSAEMLLQREFAAAEASLAIAVDALASARLVVIDAKRTVTAAIVVNGRPAGGGRPIAPERVKSANYSRGGSLRPEFDRLHALMVDYNKDLIPDGGTECADFDGLCNLITVAAPAVTADGRAFQAAAAMHHLTYRLSDGDEKRNPAWLMLKGIAGRAYRSVEVRA